MLKSVKYVSSEALEQIQSSVDFPRSPTDRRHELRDNKPSTIGDVARMFATAMAFADELEGIALAETKRLILKINSTIAEVILAVDAHPNKTLRDLSEKHLHRVDLAWKAGYAQSVQTKKNDRLQD